MFVMTFYLLTLPTSVYSVQPLIGTVQSVLVPASVTSSSPEGPVAAANLKVAASNRAVWVTDCLWHDVWLLPSSHRPAWVVFGQVTSASCASHRVPAAPICCLGVNMIHGATWQALSDGNSLSV